MCVYVSVGLSVCVCVALAVCVCVCARARIIYTAKKTEQSKPARLPCVVQQAGQAAQAYSKKGQRGAGTTVSCGPARLYSPPLPPPFSKPSHGRRLPYLCYSVPVCAKASLSRYPSH